MKRILIMGLSWGLALGIAGSIIAVVIIAAPDVIERYIQIRNREINNELNIEYNKKNAELNLEMEKRRAEMHLQLEQHKKDCNP